MKKLFLACLMMAVTVLSQAQTSHPTVTDPAAKARGLQKQLKLTNRQTEKITAIYQESAQKFDKIKVADHGDNNKMLVDLKPLRLETIRKIKAVLTPSQTVKYDNLVKETKNNGSNGWSDGWSSASSN